MKTQIRFLKNEKWIFSLCALCCGSWKRCKSIQGHANLFRRCFYHTGSLWSSLRSDKSNKSTWIKKTSNPGRIKKKKKKKTLSVARMSLVNSSLVICCVWFHYSSTNSMCINVTECPDCNYHKERVSLMKLGSICGMMNLSKMNYSLITAE